MPISDCQVRDPRVRRTRLLLQEALRRLMREKSFDAISVQNITEAATVNRATFYDHYTDKYALLDAMAAGSFHLLLAERRVRYDGSCPSQAGAIILATCDYLTQTHSDGAACMRQSAFEPLLDAAVVAAIRRVLMEGLHGSSAEDRMMLGLIAASASAAIYGAAKEWARMPERVPAEEAVPAILRLVLPILKVAQSREEAGDG